MRIRLRQSWLYCKSMNLVWLGTKRLLCYLYKFMFTISILFSISVSDVAGYPTRWRFRSQSCKSTGGLWDCRWQRWRSCMLRTERTIQTVSSSTQKGFCFFINSIWKNCKPCTHNIMTYCGTILPYIGKRKQVTYPPNLSFLCFYILSCVLFFPFQAKFYAFTLILLRDMLGKAS